MDIMIRLYDAIKLHNARVKAGIIKGECYSKTDVATMIFPVEEYSRKHKGIFSPEAYRIAARTNLYAIVERNDKYIKKSLIEKISTLLGVDPNFLFGRKSVYDEDFKKLVLNSKEDHLPHGNRIKN